MDEQEDQIKRRRLMARLPIFARVLVALLLLALFGVVLGEVRLWVGGSEMGFATMIVFLPISVLAYVAVVRLVCPEAVEHVAAAERRRLRNME